MNPADPTDSGGLIYSGGMGSGQWSQGPEVLTTELESLSLMSGGSTGFPRSGAFFEEGGPSSGQLCSGQLEVGGVCDSALSSSSQLNMPAEGSAGPFGRRNSADFGDAEDYLGSDSTDPSLQRRSQGSSQGGPSSMDGWRGRDGGPSGFKGESPRKADKQRGQGYRKLWQQVTRVGRGQKLSENGGLAFSDMTVEDLLRIGTDRYCVCGWRGGQQQSVVYAGS